MDSSSTVLLNARDPEEVRVVRMVGDKLEDLRWIRGGQSTMVGNLYAAVVTKIEPGLDAAFLDFGEGRAGFLHVGNVLDKSDPKTGEEAESSAGERRIEDLLAEGQKLVVQVQRDPIRNKGATLTNLVSMAGKRLVWMPSMRRPGVSRRIEDEEERMRLRELLSDAPFCDVGLIARTSAAGASREELLADFEHLRGQWDAAMALKVDDEGPRLLWSEPSEVIRAVRDVLRKGTEKIIIDAPEWKSSLAALLDELQGECAPPIECWSDSTSLFEKFDVERPWQLLFRSRVPVGQGASIVIHETEALTAIDVNSGRLDGGSLEETAMMANLLAAEEIARQIRLRDLGGILVIDFIDLQDRDHRSALEDNFEEWMGEDRARLKLGRLGAFGLLTMTRRRMGTGLPRAFEFSCKHCAGSGTSLHHEAGALRAMRALRVFFAQPGQRGGSLKVTPGAAAVLQSHYQQEMDGWEWDLDIQVDPQLAPGDFVLRP